MSVYFQISMQQLSRKAGRSVSAAVAYRTGEEIDDVYQGKVHDYRKKNGVLDTALFLPGGKEITKERNEFWGKVEKHHKRGDAVTSREIQCALPSELNEQERKEVSFEFARLFANRYGVAVDLALHAPRYFKDNEYRDPDQYVEMDEQGRLNNGNWHFHLIHTACFCDEEGNLGNKVEALDPISMKRNKREIAADWIREAWATCLNVALEKAGIEKRVSHLSLEAQGIDREAAPHMGHKVAAVKRKGIKTEWQKEREREAAEEAKLAQARQEVLDAEAEYHALIADAVEAEHELEAEAQAQFMREFFEREEIQQDEEFDRELEARLTDHAEEEKSAPSETLAERATRLRAEVRRLEKLVIQRRREPSPPSKAKVRYETSMRFSTGIYAGKAITLEDAQERQRVALIDYDNWKERQAGRGFFGRLVESKGLKASRKKLDEINVLIEQVERALDSEKYVEFVNKKYDELVTSHEAELESYKQWKMETAELVKICELAAEAEREAREGRERLHPELTSQQHVHHGHGLSM